MKRLVLVLLGMFILTSLHASPTKAQKTEMLGNLTNLEVIKNQPRNHEARNDKVTVYCRDYLNLSILMIVDNSTKDKLIITGNIHTLESKYFDLLDNKEVDLSEMYFFDEFEVSITKIEIEE